MKHAIDLAPYIRRGVNFFAEIVPHVWIMDDHRWAFYAWECSSHRLNKGTRYCLFHADYHYDGSNDFDTEGQITKLRENDDLDELKACVHANRLIRMDSFIAPAIIRGLLGSVHFYCLQDDTEPGLDDSLLSRFMCAQHFHTSPDDLAKNEEKPLVYDLCLDLFNSSYKWKESDLWSDTEITGFIDVTSPLIESAEIVTISLSYGYSGTEDDTGRLAQRVLPMVLKYRGVDAR